MSFTGSNTTDLERRVAYTYNPFRYRGYYYDVETGYYYLQTRYYNPEWGRFINADGIAFLGANGDPQGFNLFAYCSNDPINNIDQSGQFIGLGTIIGGIVGAATGAISGYISAISSGGDVKIAVASGAFSGCINGMIVAGIADPAGAAIAAVAVAAISMANNIANQTYNYFQSEQEKNGKPTQINVPENLKALKENIDWSDVAYTGGSSFFATLGGGIAGCGINKVLADCTPGLSKVAAGLLANNIESVTVAGLQQMVDLVYNILKG